MMQCLRLDVAADIVVNQQRAEFGPKDELAIHLRVQQRLFADAIAGVEQLLRALVPDRKHEHATQMFWTITTVAVPRVHYRFCIAVGVENVAELFQFLAQLAIVVDLAVEDDPRGVILIVDWLLAALQIDDREAAHAQAHWTIEIESALIGTAMTNRFAHPAH